MALRVLLFSDADVFAGTERHMYDLACGLIAEGVVAQIASPSPSVLKDRCEAVGIPHVAIQKNGLVDFAAVSQIRSLLDSGEIDVVHAHNGRTMLTSALAVTLARRGRAVATQHFLEPDHATRLGPKAIVFKTAHKWVSKRLSRYIAISQAVRNAMVSRNEAPEHKITVVPNGMPEVDRKTLSGSDDVRRSFNVEPDQLLIVCAARLEKEKDVSSLIQAISIVAKQNANIRCLVAGTGSLKSDLTAEIQRYGLEDRIQLLGFRDDVLSLIAASDLFILPSLAEPFGLVILEAMALSKPVIATDAGGPREIVVNGSTGILVPPSSPEALARAISSLYSDRSELTRMGSRGYDRFLEIYTARRMSQGMLQVYNDVTVSAKSTESVR